MKKSSPSSGTPAPMLPPLSVSSPPSSAIEASYPGRSYVISGPGTTFSTSPSYSREQPAPYTQAAQFGYSTAYPPPPPPPPPPPTYPIATTGYPSYTSVEEDIKPCLPSSSAFSIASTAMYSPMGNSSPVTSIEGGSMEPVHTNGFHSSQFSAFSPFASEQNSSPLQPSPPHVHSSPALV